MICLLFIYIYVMLYVNFTTHELPTQRHKNVNMSVNKLKWDKIKWTCWWRVTLLHLVCEGGFLVLAASSTAPLWETQFFPFVNTCQFWKDISFFEQASFWREKGITPQSIKEKEIFPFLISLIFPLSPSSTRNPEFFLDTKSWV